MKRLNGKNAKDAVRAWGRGALFSVAVAPLCVVGVARSQTSEQASALDEITVTGSRIRRTDGMAEPVPVTTLTPEELQLFEPGSTVAEQLDALPQFFLTTTAQRGGPALFGAGGGSYLNMRGLGQERTLVLFDGFRMPPADKRGSVNIDTFPTALVRSIDVVTGGASAAYGADAIGGVTNFILDREFQGLKFSAGTGMNDFNNDGKNWNFSVAGGMRVGERLNIIGSLETRNVDQVWRNPEDLPQSWFQRWGHVTNPAWSASDPPGTNPQRLTLPWVAPRGVHVNGRIGAFPFGVPGSSALSNMKFTEDGSDIEPLDTGDVFDGTWMSGGEDAMIANRTLAGGPSGAEVKQRTGFFSLKFEVSDSIDLFTDILVGRVESNNRQIYTGATLSGPWSPTIFRDNAFLPASVAAIMDAEGRSEIRIAKGASYPGELDIFNSSTSRNQFDSKSFRVGVDWAMNGNWDMRVSVQTGETEKLTGTFDALRVDRLALAMDAVVHPDTNEIVCNVQLYNPTEAQLADAITQLQANTTIPLVNSRDPSQPLASPIGLDNTVQDCVPFNIMGRGQISPEAAAYITTPKWGIGVVKQDFAEMLVTGQLTDGWGAGPLSLATGLTYRKQSFTDEAFPADVDALGPPFNFPELGIRGIATTWSGGSPNLHQFSTVSLISGGYNVWEAFGEVNVPIWQSASREQYLGTSFAYRSSDYSNVGRFGTWKAGIDFQIVRDLRFRATRSRDVREATFSERFDESPGGGTIQSDPERPGAGASTITLTLAGNPDLEPEVADTTVFGFVYQPRWASGLRMSIDRYEVDVSNSIATLGAQRVVDECFDSGVLCHYVFRDNDGVLSRVLNPYLNLDQAKATGTDFEISYGRDVNLFASQSESLSVRVLGGKLEERTNTVAGGTPAEFAGSRGFPGLTANVTASYQIGSWSIQLQERYIEKVLLNRVWVEGVDVDRNTIPSRRWTNMVLGYRGETAGGAAWRATFNVQNLFDKYPPIIPQAGDSRFGAQAVDNTYDTWGRRYQLGFNFDF
jgi:iron complex outermembrane recepter protein